LNRSNRWLRLGIPGQDGDESRAPFRKRHWSGIRYLRVGVPLFAAIVTASTTVGGINASGASTPANVAAAQKVIAKAETRPTSITGLASVGKAIPKGKTIAFINCGTTTCTEEEPIVTAIDTTLGWHTTIINTDGSVQETQNAWAQIIREKPNGVLYVATPRSEIDTYLTQAKADGILVASTGSVDPTGAGLSYIAPGVQEFPYYGTLQATWVVAHSNGHPAAVFLDLPDFPVISAIGQGFQKSFSEQCPGCFDGDLDIPLADIGTSATTSLIVSYLRAHPSVKYVVGGFDQLLVGLPAALKAAGLTGIDTFAEAPDSINLQYIAAGQESGTVANDSYEDLYAMINYFVRSFAGVSLPPAIRIPLWVLTKSNLPANETFFPEIKNISQYFAKLWNVKPAKFVAA
jgi:ABC-type sugar transport system substrate-binding protein